MRIALVTDWFHPRLGGIEVHVQALAQGLRARGLDVTVLTPWPGPSDVGGVPVVRLPLKLVPGLGVSLSPLGLVRTLGSAFAAHRFDLVHTHVSFGSTTAIAVGYAGPRAGVPVLATFHSVFGPLGWVYRMAQPILRWRRWPFHATAVSEAVMRDLLWIMPEREVGLLPCAIDPEAWPRAEGGRQVGRLRLVATARLQRRKRVDALIRVLKRVRSDVAHHADVTLEVLGDGPERQALERLAVRLGVEGSVRFLGAGDATSVRHLLSRGDVFVSAAHRESFGIAALEALSSGVPVVGRAEGGMGSFVTDGRNGKLVASDDEMASVLSSLARSEDDLRRLRVGAAGGVPAAFTWNVVLDRHLELYQALARTEAAAR